jgi:metal-responsive CopG/Arc/MetJ family transcriptional regulator
MYILRIYTKEMKRGAVRKSEAKAVLVNFPLSMMVLIDDAVHQLDSDRSKFIRAAVREKIQRAGFVVKESR